MLNKKLILIFLFSGLFIISSCKKVEKVMMVTTGDVTDTTFNSAKVSGQIIDLGDGANEYGHYYSTNANETASGLKTKLGIPSGTVLFTSQLTGLTSGTRYYIKAYISKGTDIKYGTEISFTTLSVPPPILASVVVENATPSVLEMTYSLTLANIVPGASAFTVQVNSVGRTVSTIVISGTKVLLTLASPVLNGDVVTVAYSKPASNPLQTASGGQAAALSAQVVTNNVNPVSNPLYVSSVIENATPSLLEMTYNMTLANVTPSASAFTVQVNSVGRTVSTIVISGTKVQLTLSSPVLYGDVVTVAYIKPASNPLQTSSGGQAATLSAQAVTNNLNPVIPQYVSSVIENATPSLLEITYNMTLANIVPAASAFTVQVNSAGRTVSTIVISATKVQLTLASPVLYGDVVTVAYSKPASNPLQTATGVQPESFTAQSVTNNCITVPSITTTAITSVSTTTAISGGNITSSGGSSITVRGVCWNTATGPTTSNNKTSNGTGTGSYASNLTGLAPNTTYYVRAYATNSAGTAYGNEHIFTTNPVAPVLPTLTTTAVTGIATTTGISGGNITSDGGASVTSRGVCWNTAINPTIVNNKTSDLTGTGSFVSNLTGLLSNTTYYVRAYATNSVGTAYGNQVSFKTAIPSVTTKKSFTVPGSSPTALEWDGTSLWMVDNLRNFYHLDTLGNVLGTFAFHADVSDLAWDGTALWAYTSTQLEKIDAAGNILSVLPISYYPFSGIAWDGTHFWIGDYNSGKIYKHEYGGNLLLFFEAGFFGHPTGMTFNGSDLLIGDSFEAYNRIYLYSRAGIEKSYVSLDEINLQKIQTFERKSLAWDGIYLWYSSTARFEIYKLKISW